MRPKPSSYTPKCAAGACSYHAKGTYTQAPQASPAHQLCSTFIVAMLLHILHQPGQKCVPADRLCVAHQRDMPPGPGDRHVHAPHIRQKPYLSGSVAASTACTRTVTHRGRTHTCVPQQHQTDWLIEGGPPLWTKNQGAPWQFSFICVWHGGAQEDWHTQCPYPLLSPADHADDDCFLLTPLKAIHCGDLQAAGQLVRPELFQQSHLHQQSPTSRQADTPTY